jgi:hypothetical protein
MVCPGYKYGVTLTALLLPSIYVIFSDTMIDLGFVISSFVPLVLFWM